MNHIFKHIILFAIYFTVAVIFLHPSTAVIIATILTVIPGVLTIVNVLINAIRSWIYKPEHNMRKVVIHKHLRRPLFKVPRWFVFESREEFTIKRWVKFTHESKYDNKKYLGTQKLFGFSLFHPHMESYRVGWRYDGNCFTLHAYIHRDGKVIDEIIHTVKDIRVPVSVSIVYDCGVVRYYSNDRLIVSYKTAYKYRFALAWINNPYVEIKQRISFLMK